VERGVTTDIGTVEMERGRRIGGIVYAESGARLPKARVFTGHGSRFARGMSRLHQLFWARYEVTTDDTGAFEFDGVDPIPGSPYSLLIWATHPAFGSSVMRRLPSGCEPLSIEVRHSGRMQGLVAGFGGNHALACAFRPDESEIARLEPVDHRGEFQFDDLPPGRYRTSIDGLETDAQNVLVSAGETTFVTFTMKVATIVSLRIRIFGATEEASIPVLAHEDETERPMRPAIGAIVAYGYVEHIFEAIPPGRYRFSSDHKTWLPIVVTAAPQVQRIEIGR
jgi:hypothetical protein